MRTQRASSVARRGKRDMWTGPKPLPLPEVVVSAPKEGAAELTPEEQEALEETRKAILAAYQKRFETVRRGVQLDGDDLSNLEDYYQETILGKGGKPQGFMLELILRSFFGKWDRKNNFIRSYDFTGDDHQPGPADFEEAWQTFKKNAMEGLNFEGQDDGQGWTWLVVRQKWNGLQLYLTASPPFGERPIAVMKQSELNTFFNKVDWPRVFARMYNRQLWGGSALEFPFLFSRKVVRA